MLATAALAGPSRPGMRHVRMAAGRGTSRRPLPVPLRRGIELVASARPAGVMADPDEGEVAMRGWWWSRRLRTRRGLRDALLALALLGAGGAAAQQAPDASARWQALSAEAMDAFRRGQSAEAAVAAERALALARGAFGPRHPQTLNSMNNLAFLYRNQGRHGEAEPLYREALQLTREVLGPRHPRTLAGMNNLATLYERQGRHGEAEPLYREALQLTREMFGPQHPNTVRSTSNLATLHRSQGLHGVTP